MHGRSLLASLLAALILAAAAPGPAPAVSPGGVVCTVGGLLSGIVGKACNAARHAGAVVSAGRKLLGGHVGSAIKALGGGASTAAGGLASRATFALGLAVVGDWIGGGAHAALRLVGGLLDRTTRPRLQSTWFSATYWRVAAISALLTLPFLFAAAVQALLRSDLALLWRAAFGYLPLALLAVGVAAPLTMLLLAAVDGMSGAVSAAAGGASGHFLNRLAAFGGALAGFSKSPFLACVLAVLLVLVSVVLWLELLVRDAAIYVVVLMLPLVFATLVWPARRVWATRSMELLFALILSKFAVVAVLSLGGAALNSAGYAGVGTMSLGLILVGLAATAPWVLMRLLPVVELSASLQGMRHGGELRPHLDSGLEAGAVGHARAQDARGLPPGEGDVAALEVAKLGRGSEPMAPTERTLGDFRAQADSADRISAGEADRTASPGGPHVAGYGDLTASTEPLSADAQAERDAGYSDGSHLELGESGQLHRPPAPPPDTGPSPAPDAVSPTEPAGAPSPADIVDLRPPRDPGSAAPADA